MFKDIKDAVKDAFQQVKDFFALFGNGDAMKGFANIASQLVKMLPALLVLKGIMMLASATKTIKNLATAMGLIAAKGSVPGVGTPPVVAGAKPSLGILKAAGFLAVGAEALLVGSQMTNDAAVIKWSRLGVDLRALQASGMNARMLQTEAGVALARKKFPYKGPRLAKGGIVMPSPGGTNVTVGEGGQAEAIVPLNGRNGFGNTVNIYVTAADPKAVVDAVSKYVKGNGKLPSAWGR
jgi:hypothetical protein